MMEVLSPAGSWDSLRAAVQSGADAVYMGFGAFNARRNAQNFDDDSFHQAVEYCHLYGVKVYLTLNTLVFDREFPAVKDILLKANQFGVDAVLIQDWGIYTLAREIVPDLVLHASTQMSLFTSGGAKIAAEMGLQRIVLAREVSRYDIEQITNNTSLEIEVFVHGALCMCYSGQCSMSALIGQRSGNRGTCAQPCRLPYQVNNSKSNLHPLSLKDSSLAPYVPELKRLGVSCLKIEGRMKRPEYVAIVTSVYRRLVDENRKPTEKESAALFHIFNRDGFTSDYYAGKKGPDMFGTRAESFTEPETLLVEARTLYEKDDHRKVPVSMECCISALETTLNITDGVHSLQVSGEVSEAGRNRFLTEDEVKDRLCKTGGTAFTCTSCLVHLDEGRMLSAGAINALRRNALDSLAGIRKTAHVGKVMDEAVLPEVPAEPTDLRLTVSISRPEQLTLELLSLQPAVVYIPIEIVRAVDSQILKSISHLSVILPRVFRDKDESVFSEIINSCPYVQSVCISNIGQLPMARKFGFPIRSDFGLNVTNSRSLLFLKQYGISSSTLSYELRYQQIRDMKKFMATEAIIYGRLPLMIMENCIISNSGECNCENSNFLKDRVGEMFPVQKAYGCRNELENSKVLFLADKTEYRSIGLTYGRLRFTTETPEDCVIAMNRYLQNNEWKPENFTRGLFYRGVD